MSCIRASISKSGLWRGMTEELRMVGDALRVISPAGVVRQHVELKRLSRSMRDLAR